MSVHPHVGRCPDKKTEQRGFIVMFMLMFLFGLISFVTADFHLFLCYGMEKYKGDRFSPHRKKAWKNVRIHFYVTFLFFYLAFHI